MAKRITLILLAFFSSQQSFSQAPDPFWSENFGAALPTGWTTSDSSPNEILWEYCGDFLTCPPNDHSDLLPLRWFESTSFEDGYIYLSPYQMPNDTNTHESVLTSALISCEDKNEVFLKFNSLIFSGESEPEGDAILQVKIGNGAWQDFTIFENFKGGILEEGPYGFQSYNPHSTSIDLTSIAANEPQVTLRWIWKWKSPFAYFWGLDDVELFDSNPLFDKVAWGALPSEGDFNGDLGGWTTLSSGQCGWQWSEDGLLDNPDQDNVANYYVNSPTASNGSAVVLTTNCIPIGAPPSLTYSELISPNIDLSALPTGKKLDVKFHQTGAFGNQASVTVPISTIRYSFDGGSTYSDPVRLNQEKAFLKVFNEEVSIPLPEEAAGTEFFRMKFIFNGFDIFWALDDIRIVERDQHDLAIHPLYFTTAPNYSTPAPAVTPISFGADISNHGTDAQDSANLYIDVMKKNSQEVVFSDTLTIGTIEAGETLEELYFEKKFEPEKWSSKYICQYRVEFDEEDEDTPNDKIYFQFEVSDTVFSKCKGPESINAAFFPQGILDYEVGNCFFVPPGANMTARGINFAFHKNFGQLDGVTLKAGLYKWKSANSYGDVNNDTIANNNEFEAVSFGSFNTDDFVSNLDPLNQVYFAPISDDFESIPLEDSTYYFATIEYKHENNGVVFLIAASEEIDYTSMYLQSHAEELPRYVSVLKLGTDDDFLINSWGLKRIPYVEMVVERQFTSTDEVNDVGFDCEIFPNPAQGELHVDLSGIEFMEECRIEVYDVIGQILHFQEVENKSVSQISIPTSHFNNGSYILRIVSGGNFISKPFIVLNE